MGKAAERAPGKPAEARDDPHLKEFVANARRIADERATDTEEALKVQAHHDRVRDQMLKNAAKTRRQAEQ